MSRAPSSVEECPACGAERVTRWEDIKVWVCDECSYVVDDTTTKSSAPNFSANTSSDEVEDRDWEQVIAVEDKSEANLVEVVSEAERVAEELGLSEKITLRAAEIVVEAWKVNFTHGRTMPDVVGASVYAASREVQRSVPPAIIADNINTDKQSIKSTYQQLKSELRLDIEPPSPTEYTDHICRESNLPDGVGQKAEELLEEHRITGNPVGIAAAACYEAANTEGYRVTLRGAAEKVGLTKETIWRHSSKFNRES